MKKHFIVFTFIFAIVVGFWMGRWRTPDKSGVPVTPQATANPILVTDPVVQKAQATPDITAKNKSPTVAVEALKVIMPNDDQRLNHWLHERLGAGRVISRVAAADRGYFTDERLDDGRELEREYSGTGMLVSEVVNEKDKTRITRNFYSNGQVKYLMFEPKNGIKDMTTVDSGGFPTQRTVEFTDGSKLVFEYDESGNVTHKIFFAKDQPGRVVE